MTPDLHTAALLPLVQWLSPAFPTGAFAYSHGLEAVIDAGEVRNARQAQDWLSDILRFGAGWQDAVLLACALRHDADHAALAEYARALAPSRERLAETLDQGTALARGVAALAVVVDAAPLPVVLGQAAQGLALRADQVIALYLHSFAANLVSVAVRFVPLGQSDGQRILAALHPLILDLAARAATASLDDLTTATFRADLAAMSHETMDIRIYRT
jgi:urease accessory protein